MPAPRGQRKRTRPADYPDDIRGFRFHFEREKSGLKAPFQCDNYAETLDLTQLRDM